MRPAATAGIPCVLTRRPRSTGSALKPFIYAAAFAQRICTPATEPDDRPACWTGFVPHDYDRGWCGRLSAAETLADSRNLPAMHLLARLGTGRIGAALECFGLTGMGLQARRAGLTLAVGGGDVTPPDPARAYAALARRANGPSTAPAMAGDRKSSPTARRPRRS